MLSRQFSHSDSLIGAHVGGLVKLVQMADAKQYVPKWMLCSDACENLHKTHMCLGQGLGVSMQLKKFQNLFCGFGIFSEIVRVTLLSGHTVHSKK